MSGKSRLCQLLQVKYPIVQAPMLLITGADLVAAVSRAGGLGTLGPNSGLKELSYDPQVIGEALRKEIRKVKSLTDNPFAVNLPVGRRGKDVCDRRVEVCIEEGVPIAIVSVGSPSEYTAQLKAAGIKVIHVISSVEKAKRAEEAGVDAVAAVGYEAGGHSGFEKLPCFVLVPQVVEAVGIPVIAGGGIVDARGFVAALSLGAEGIYMGTRFMTAKECSAHENVKSMLVAKGDKRTASYGKGAGRGMWRGLRNEFVDEYEKMEASGASAEELLVFMTRFTDESGKTFSRHELALVHGDVVRGSIPCGAGISLVSDVASVADIIQSLMDGAKEILQKAQKALGI